MDIKIGDMVRLKDGYMSERKDYQHTVDVEDRLIPHDTRCMIVGAIHDQDADCLLVSIVCKEGKHLAYRLDKLERVPTVKEQILRAACECTENIVTRELKQLLVATVQQEQARRIVDEMCALIERFPLHLEHPTQFEFRAQYAIIKFKSYTGAKQTVGERYDMIWADSRISYEVVHFILEPMLAVGDKIKFTYF